MKTISDFSLPQSNSLPALPALLPSEGAQSRTTERPRKSGPSRQREFSASGFAIVSSEALSFFPELTQHLGADPHALLRLAGIEPSILASRGSVLEYRSLIELLEITARTLQCPDFGLRFAALQGGTRVMGPIGVVMKNSQTVGQALGYCKKQIHAYSLATRVRFMPDRPHHKLFVGLEILLDGVAQKAQIVEHALMLANLNVIDISSETARARQISFRHAPVSAPSVYREAFQCDVRFGEDVDGLVLEERDLLCPVVRPDEQVYRIATSFIDEHFPPAKPPLHARVRSLIGQYLASDSAYERIAADLCMHPRTLQRHLRNEGRTFEGIKDEVRQEAALRFLQRPDIPLTQVAAKLGYADQTVLSRSCCRWFDATPGELRRRATNALHGFSASHAASASNTGSATPDEC